MDSGGAVGTVAERVRRQEEGSATKIFVVLGHRARHRAVGASAETSSLPGAEFGAVGDFGRRGISSGTEIHVQRPGMVAQARFWTGGCGIARRGGAAAVEEQNPRTDV